MLIYGHRGAAGEAPENTPAAFRRALALGIDGVEFDVRGTADGVPVVLHDRGLERTTTGRGNVDELPLAAAQAADAGGGERVPTLAEVVGMVGGRTRLDVELKQPGLERPVLDLLAGVPEGSWVISSFDWDVLRAVRQLHPTAPLWPLTMVADDALFTVAAELAAPAVALWSPAFTATVARRCADAGLEAMVWTVNDPHEARRVRALGAAVLCTDLPGAIRRAVSEEAGV
jgi:glycerophosphoryl diester phosphodiesterase